MTTQWIGRRRGRVLVGVLVGLALGSAWGCKKGKRSKTPEECMAACEEEQCGYNPNTTASNDEYLECLEACGDKCS